MKNGFNEASVVGAVCAFVGTMRKTAGMTKEEVKKALHPEIIDKIFEIEEGRESQVVEALAKRMRAIQAAKAR